MNITDLVQSVTSGKLSASHAAALIAGSATSESVTMGGETYVNKDGKWICKGGVVKDADTLKKLNAKNERAKPHAEAPFRSTTKRAYNRAVKPANYFGESKGMSGANNSLYPHGSADNHAFQAGYHHARKTAVGYDSAKYDTHLKGVKSHAVKWSKATGRALSDVAKSKAFKHGQSHAEGFA